MVEQGWATFFGLRAEIGKINDKILPHANQNFKGSPTSLISIASYFNLVGLIFLWVAK